MNIGKKILSAFVEVSETKLPVPEEPSSEPPRLVSEPQPDADKFKQHFQKLFEDANIPGPDYFEFSKMIEAMKVITDEKARYQAAYAGLSVQGLDQTKLLSSASQYLQILDTDAANFNASVDNALQEKVRGKKAEIELKNKRIEQLSAEIDALHQAIAILQNEVRENQEKIDNSNNGYQSALNNLKSRITEELEKIKQHIN